MRKFFARRCFQISEQCKDVLQALERNILFGKLDTFLLESEQLAKPAVGNAGFPRPFL
jgi:hypothetical protein